MDGGGSDSFEFQVRTRMVAGRGAVRQLVPWAIQYSARRSVLLTTDPGLVASGHAGDVERLLKDAGLAVAKFDGCHENPSTEDVADCLAVARESSIDLIVGLGGGSSLDVAKGCNFLLTNGGRMAEYRGFGKASRPLLPFIAIPTTAGTGSEMQSYAILADELTHEKMACGDPSAAARVAILDPELTVSQPARVTAASGIDALSHALESAVTTRRATASLLFAREAFRTIVAALPKVLANPGDIAARAGMQLGAAYAGIAIENSMLGAAHAAANPVSAHYGSIHGFAVGVMLPWVVRMNADSDAAATYAELAVAAGWANRNADVAAAVEALAEGVESLIRLTGAPTDLHALGVETDSLPQLAAEAATQWTGKFNPKPVGEGDFLALYERAFFPDRTARPVLVCGDRTTSGA